MTFFSPYFFDRAYHIATMAAIRHHQWMGKKGSQKQAMRVGSVQISNQGGGGGGTRKEMLRGSCRRYGITPTLAGTSLACSGKCIDWYGDLFVRGPPQLRLVQS